MITNKSNLIANINNEIVDNTEGKISPYDVRHNLIDIVDSVSLLLEDQSINTLNFATPNTRSIRAGQYALNNLGLENASGADNVAVGYSALKAHYQGDKNTAVGSQALNCNVYGISNTAVGFNALGGNTTGNGNVGLGNNTLLNNKLGDFNIAIGNAAGYYVDRNTSYKLFIASHPINSDYICDNRFGSGLIPLIHGDLNQSSLRFGIATRDLHYASALQVSGGIAPAANALDDLGHSSYRFKNLYLSNTIYFPSGKYIEYGNSGQFVANNDLYPSATNTFDLGSSPNRWKTIHTKDLYVYGTATIQTVQSISNCLYECKTLYLASSGLCDSNNGCGYLNDQQLNGAGLVIKASGLNYLRDYFFLFRPSGNDIKCLESNNIYSKSHWQSNISLHIDSGNHIKVDRVVSSGKLSLSTDPNCYGLFLNKERAYLSRENVVPISGEISTSLIAALGDVNFIKDSGTSGNEYNFTLGVLDSGISISQKFANGIKQRTQDPLNAFKDKLRGFELKYFDQSPVFPQFDRFVIRSFDNTSDGVNNLILMKKYNNGVFGINNFATGGDTLYPQTILNIRSKDNAVVRVAAENATSGVHSALQLIGGNNCLIDGFENIYYHNSGIVDVNLYQNSGKLNIFRYTPYQAGLFSSGVSNATLTIGHSGFPRAAISLRDDQFVTGPAITATSGYGKIFNNKVNREYAQQSHTLYFLDSSGWLHDLTTNKYDTIDARALYSENFLLNSQQEYGNTFGGYSCPNSRITFSNQRSGNTAYGSYSLYSLASGDYNTTIGVLSAPNITNGYENIVLGAKSAVGFTNGYKNIAIGNSTFNTSFNTNNNIIIGNSLAAQHSGNYKLLIGANTNLVSGSMGPLIGDKVFALPQSGNLEIYDLTNLNKLTLKNNNINIYNETTNRFPQDQLKFNFATPSGSNTLLILDHSVAASGSGNYACSGLPYAELKGNLKLQNNLCFADGTNLNSARFLSTISNLESSGISINNRFNSLLVEGIVLQTINNPSSLSPPTSGLMQTIRKQGNTLINGPNITIINRDKYLKIDSGSYAIAIFINNEYRPIWVSNETLTCETCKP